jgi:predicted RNA-binding protein YlxR (DUF448 family)
MKETVKKTPQRTCVVCRAEKDKSELIRVVKTPEGEIIANPGAKVNGRGAYVCKDGDCILRAKKERKLEKALKCPIPPFIYDTLEEDRKSVV